MHYRRFPDVQLNRAGKNLVIYALALGFLGSIVGGDWEHRRVQRDLRLGGYPRRCHLRLIIGVIVYGIVYYIVVISRWPGDAPLVAAGPTGGYGNPPGGYGSPPPPPPPSA